MGNSNSSPEEPKIPAETEKDILEKLANDLLEELDREELEELNELNSDESVENENIIYLKDEVDYLHSKNLDELFIYYQKSANGIEFIINDISIEKILNLIAKSLGYLYSKRLMVNPEGKYVMDLFGDFGFALAQTRLKFYDRVKTFLTENLKKKKGGKLKEEEKESIEDKVTEILRNKILNKIYRRMANNVIIFLYCHEIIRYFYMKRKKMQLEVPEEDIKDLTMSISELDSEIISIFTGEHNKEIINLVDSNRILFDDNEYFPAPLYEEFRDNYMKPAN